MNRYITSVYINQANGILSRIYASPGQGRPRSMLTSADASASAALAAYDAMNYGGAASHAKDAYSKVLAAASHIHPG